MKKPLLTAGMLACLALSPVARAADEGMQPDGAMKHDDASSMSGDKMKPGKATPSGHMTKEHAKMKAGKKAGSAMKDDKMGDDKMMKRDGGM